MLQKMFLYAIGLVLLCTSAHSQTSQSDTVWSKYIGSEVKAVKFSPDGQYIYAIANERKPMKLNAETGEILREYEQIITSSSMDITKNGREMVVGGEERKIQRFNLETAEIVNEFKIPDSLNTSQYFDRVSISSLSISEDEKYLAAALIGINSIFENVRRVLVWDYQSGKLLKIIDDNWCKNVLFSPTNQILAISHSKSSDNEISLLVNGTWETYANLCCHSSLIEDIAFSPDGSLLASCGSAGEIKIWDIFKKDSSLSLEDCGNLTSIAFEDNHTIVCDGNIDFTKRYTKVWDLEKKQVIGMIKTNKPWDLDVDINTKNCILALTDYLLLFNINNVTSYKIESYIPDFEVKMIPNPSSYNSIIEIQSNQELSINIDLLDVNSRIIKQFKNNYIKTGRNEVIWNTTDSSAGVYFCRISSKTFTKTYKIILEK